MVNLCWDRWQELGSLVRATRRVGCNGGVGFRTIHETLLAHAGQEYKDYLKKKEDDPALGMSEIDILRFQIGNLTDALGLVRSDRAKKTIEDKIGELEAELKNRMWWQA